MLTANINHDSYLRSPGRDFLYNIYALFSSVLCVHKLQYQLVKTKKTSTKKLHLLNKWRYFCKNDDAVTRRMVCGDNDLGVRMLCSPDNLIQLSPRWWANGPIKSPWLQVANMRYLTLLKHGASQAGFWRFPDVMWLSSNMSTFSF